jgi:hypothetical protein
MLGENAASVDMRNLNLSSFELLEDERSDGNSTATETYMLDATNDAGVFTC